ncbi:MAG: hypothetical protein DI533_20065 [Cereibacter sphaeroides]|uniref:Uncharacterized protein n=1 Tax=Cereibacter sphaeroides TaxID=1063 RepID=A0A2W5RWU5_CERSP|nr:MAG: hypothetical protein DI533_20065 [Cereibacter sphaeroides]
MNDRAQMWDDICRELARTAPAPGKSDIPSNLHIFPADVLFSSVFKPGERQHIFPEKKVEDFAITFPMKDLPIGLVTYVQPRKWQDTEVATAHTRFAPSIIPTKTSKCDLDTTVRCGRASNIEPDRLLRKARVEIAVEAVEFESRMPYIPASRYRHGGNARLVRRLELRAIRVNVDTMVDTYDEILAELHEDFDGWRE